MKIDNIKDNIDYVCNDFIMKRRGKAPRFRAFLRMLLKFVDDMRADYVGQYAAQAAFFTILSAVPFLMLIILCLKYFVSVDLTAFIDTIDSVFPSQVSIYVSKIITEVFYRSESMAVLSATAIAALWASSRGTMAVYCGLNQIYGYVRMYNWFSARIASFFYNILIVAVIVATIIILVFGNTLMSFMDSEFVLAHYALVFILNMKFPIFFVLFVLAFTALYKVLPQRKTKFRSHIVGAVATAGGWIGFSYVFSIYIEYFAKYSLIYGSLTAVVLLMLWIFFGIYMLLIGAEINKHIEMGFFKRVKKNVFYKKRTPTRKNDEK